MLKELTQVSEINKWAMLVSSVNIIFLMFVIIKFTNEVHNKVLPHLDNQTASVGNMSYARLQKKKNNK